MDVAHIIENIHSFPFVVLGRGPTQSIINSSSIIGMGCNGAFGTFELAFPAIWHAWHMLQ